jgi:hypothetical protein
VSGIELFSEPIGLDAGRLQPGDIVFAPRVGKRLIAAHRGTDVFLDYPKRPRVKGNPLVPAEEQRCAEDVKQLLGWFCLSGEWEVVGRRDLTVPVEDAAPVDVTDDIADKLRALYEQLLATTEDLNAIANRTIGRPINPALNEAVSQLRALDAATRTLPTSRKSEELAILVQDVRRSADSLAGDIKAGVPASMNRQTIGAVQAYDDDF